MEDWTEQRARAALRDIFDAAVASADPGTVIWQHLPAKPKGKCVVVGAGKASAAMAAALDAAWPDVDVAGVVVTRYGHAVPAGRIRVLQAAHPVPDAASVAAAHEILLAVRGLSADDLVVALMSGGGSALMTLPAGNMTLADKQAVNAALLRSGAAIGEINIVRKHLSAVKGGRLAAAAKPARIVTLVISDVPGDAPAIIASGPTVADATTKADARRIVEKHRINLPPAAAAVLAGPEDAQACGHAGDIRMLAAPMLALEAGAEKARQLGLTPVILGDGIEGESRELGTAMAGMARSVRVHGRPVDGPAVLLSGGETTVTIRSDHPGKGGRNTEFLLSLALAAKGEPGIWALAGDSDGVDGTEDAAGAIMTPSTLARAGAAGLDPQAALAGHDSYSVFAALGDLVITGPTLTNVNDIRAILVAHAAQRD